MKKRLIVICMMLLLTLSVNAIASERMAVFSGLEGVVYDEASELRLNPAQLNIVAGNTLLGDLGLTSSSDYNRFYLLPVLVYNLEETTIGFDFGFEKRGQAYRYPFKLAIATELDGGLVLGGKFGFQHSSEPADEMNFDFLTGMSYQVDNDLTIDGRIGVVNDELSLFLRAKKNLNNNQDLVVLVDYNSELEPGGYNFRVGKVTRQDNKLFVYGMEFEQKNKNNINFAWGAEFDFSDNLIFRVGDKYNVFSSNNKRKLSTPKIDSINLGLTYHYSRDAKFDISYTPYFELGDDSKLEFDTSFSINF